MPEILSITEENIILSLEKLKSDELVAFPTETVYGLGGNAYSDKAVAEIFAYKNRPNFNPLPVCYANLERASNDVFINDLAIKLAENFLPGPLTMLLKRRPDSKISHLASDGLDTICVRIPSNSVSQKLLLNLDFPLAVPSANRSAGISPTNAQAVAESLRDCEKLIILDGGQCNIGIESTIIDLVGENPKILRYGAIDKEEISRKCNIVFEEKKEKNSATLKHYVTTKKIIKNAEKAGENDALLAFGTPFPNNCMHVLNLSPSGDLNEAAANFFSMLRELDRTDSDNICIMKIPEKGIGIALNDRIRKAAQEN